jgi:CARDB
VARARIALLVGLATVAASGFTLAADAQPGAEGPEARTAQAPRQMAGQTVKIRGRLASGRTFRRPQRMPEALRRELERRFSQEVNPPGTDTPAGGDGPGPQEPATTDATSDGPRRSHAGHRRAPRNARERFAPRPRVAAAAADDYVLFRSAPVAQGTGITTATGEPTVANDRNGLLFTGNTHAAVSGDNGITWSYLNPATQFANSDGGFCCDQVAYAVDRGGTSLVLWLLQYRNDGALNPSDNTNGRLRMAVFQGRNKLLGGSDELLDQTDYCTIDFKPSDFGMPSNSYFDFNQMSHTEKFLYISSKAFQNNGDTNGDGSFDGSYLDGVVWRIDLDDLDDDDACDVDTTFWSGIGTDRNPALVQGAGKLDTMYWASQSATSTSEILVTKVRDSSTVGDVFTPAITSFLQTERQSPTTPVVQNANCPLPDGSDPCLRVNDDINTGYTTPTEVGWFWNVREGNGFPFPHVRGVRFSTVNPQNPLTRIGEPDIWHDQHAFLYSTVGVNDAFHVGLTVYRAGGPAGAEKQISARAALIDDVTPSWSSLSFHGIITSDSGVAANTWGDYQAVRPYGNCENTFAAAVQSMQGGTTQGSAEHRFAWFGRERDGCADLAVVSLAAYRLAVEYEGEETLTIGLTTRNIGSGTAGASTTRLYLSRDAEQSSDDVELADEVAVPSLAATEGSDSHGAFVLAAVPTNLSGTYYVIACADDERVVEEISDTNNCLTAPQTVTVTREFQKAPVGITGIRHVTDVPVWKAGTKFPIELELQFPTRQIAQRGTEISFHLNSSAGLRGATRLGQATIRYSGAVAPQQRQRGGRRVRFRRQVRVPRGLQHRRLFLIACVGKRPQASRCLPAGKPIFVRGVRRR